jgi:hypothetical protein
VFAVAVAAIFLLRGLVLLSVLPPFEGWDEYQHLGYIVFISEQGRPPIRGRDHIPASMFNALRAYPHARHSADQLAAIGALPYDKFWSTDPHQPDSVSGARIALYQAQHSPLYYRLMGPIFSAFGGVENILASVAALRLFNLLCGGVSVLLVVVVIGRICVDRSRAYLVGLLIGLSPLYLLNCARIASDALSIMIATATIALLLIPSQGCYFWRAAGVGLLSGLAVLSKASCLVLLPVAVAALLVAARRTGAGWRSALLAILLFAAAHLAPTFSYYRSSLREFGTLTGMQEAVKNQADGKGPLDYWLAASEIDWPQWVRGHHLRNTLWMGGWSFLRARGAFRDMHEWILVIGFLGWLSLLLVRKRTKEWLFRDSSSVLPLLWLLCACVTAGLAYHTLQSKVAWGTPTTNPWYAMLALPWFVCLFYQGALGYPGRLVKTAIPSGLAILYVVAEFYGCLFLMIPHYTAHATAGEAWRRLVELHAVFPGPVFAIPAALAALALTALAGGTAIRAFLSPSRELDTDRNAWEPVNSRRG